jgi:2-polyprenyl-3-methyl-5-hydroxy-6-metoxy-1,4-benzoquinol methylase
MPEQVKFCPLCGMEKFSVFDQRNFRSFQVTNVLCSQCGLVFQTPRMSESELDTFYQDQYRVAYQGQEGPSDRDLKVQKARAEYLVDLLQRMEIKQVQNYLDIGSSAGSLIERVQQVFGFDTVGVEPGEAYRHYAESRGIRVYKALSLIEEAEIQRFDLVSLIHVLEHLPDPIDYLKALRIKFLTRNAKLLVEVPNLYAHNCFEVAHLTSFSSNRLVEVLNKAGFKCLFIERHGNPRSKLIPLYITVFAEPIIEDSRENKIESEKLVRLKRRTGLLHRRIVERLFPSYAWIQEFRS